MKHARKILIVEDEYLIRKGIVNIIDNSSDENYEVFEAQNMKTAIKKALMIKPDIILMDLQLGDGTGAEACRIILAEQPNLPVLFFSMYDDETSVLAAMLSGASGYLVKDIEHKTLLQAISLTLQGFTLFHQKSLPFLLESSKTNKVVKENKFLKDLSPQQKKVLELVTLGLTNKEIGKVMNLSDKTIRNYLSIIFDKLGISKRTEAAVIYTESTQNKD